MQRAKRRFLIAAIAAIAIAASAGFVIADSRFDTRKVVADSDFGDEQARAPSVSAQSFFYLHEGEYTMAEHLQDR
jgi:hypothetical protein